MSHFNLIHKFVPMPQAKKIRDAQAAVGQKTTSNDSSPMAKARPCLVARDPRSEEISSQSLGSLVNPEDSD